MMNFLEKNGDEYQNIIRGLKKKKTRNFFVGSSIGIFILLLILKIPLIVVLVVGVCIGLLGWGNQIEILDEEIDSVKTTKRRQIKKLFLIGIPSIILIGLIVLTIENYIKTGREDVLKVSKQFASSFIGGAKYEVLRECFSENKKEIDEKYTKMRNVYPYLIKPQVVNSKTHLTIYSRLWNVVVCTYQTQAFSSKSLYLSIILMNDLSPSLWQRFLESVYYVKYLNYLFPFPYGKENWKVYSFEVDDNFEKVLKEEYEEGKEWARIRFLESKSKLSEIEKKEYDKYVKKRKQKREELEPILSKYSPEKYKQFEKAFIELQTIWISNEQRRQFNEVKTWDNNIDQIWESLSKNASEK